MAYIGKVPTAVPLTSADIQDGTIQAVDLASGVLPANTPAFQASMSADQSVTNSIYIKVQFDTESFDTDGCYDNVTNYRFTPNVAGKYFFYITTRNDSITDTQLDINLVALYKNGTRIRRTAFDPAANYGRSNSPTLNHIETANGTTDYFEAYVYVADQSGTPQVQGDEDSIFGAYRIGN